VIVVAVLSTVLVVWGAWQLRSEFARLADGVRRAGGHAGLRARGSLRKLLPDAGTALLIVLGLSLLARVLWLNLPQGALIFDEAYYVNAARVILGIHPPAGAHYADAPLFLDPNTEHPPFGKVLIAGSMALFGDNGFGWRVPSLIAGLVALAALYGIVRGLGGRPWLGVLAVGLYSLDILSFIHGRIGTLDMMSVAFLLLGAWLAIRERWLLAGAALALGTLVKVPGVYGFVAVLAWQGLALWRASRRERLTRAHFVPLAALTGAYVLVSLVGLWLLDLRFTDYPTPLDHVSRMLSYGLALQGGFNPSGITSAPWQWLVNEGQFDYLKTAVNTLVNGQITGSRTIVEFRALLNPVLIGSASVAVLYGIWLAWRRKEPLAAWGLIWIGANYLPFWALALFANRVTYFYYALPAVPGLVLLTTALLVHGRFPRPVQWGYVAAAVVAFVAWFPFRQVP
jgi:4-amino-4-deoxy-L-arabinose transferase-like glycosyltransferase